MPEPIPIKNGCLQGGNTNLYGNRDAIRVLIMGTRPEEFGPVADSYRKTADLLTTTITTLGDSAARLVADGNWGGESARAMLTRMNRLQAYLRSLRDGVNGVPPALVDASAALAEAKKTFDQTTKPVHAYAMGAGSTDPDEPVNDPDGAARAVMTQLNGAYRNAHTALPDRLPWDAALASPAPYLPAVAPGPTPTQGGDLRYEDTVPARSSELAQAAGHQQTSPGSPPGASPAQPPVSTAPVTGGTLAPGTPALTVPAGTGQLSGATSSNGQTPTTGTSTQPSTSGAGQPNANGQVPAASTPVTPSARPTTPAPSSTGNQNTGRAADPYTRTAQESGGPSVRAGSVPVVDGSWNGSKPPASGGGAGGTGTSGMPFMPMSGAAAPDNRSSSRPMTSKSDDDFFRPEVDCGPPVVG
ncbi:hypothetical protein [Nonomuraea insulae]|uniref:Uncharacterized protein n=1 Tax=Nonomuraea insulae TaxID=1616787 RepID=A0ABW1CF16_9ACTN